MFSLLNGGIIEYVALWITNKPFNKIFTYIGTPRVYYTFGSGYWNSSEVKNRNINYKNVKRILWVKIKYLRG